MTIVFIKIINFIMVRLFCIALLLNLVYLSPENTNFFNSCVGCINNGDEFCSIVPEMEPGKCCTGMVSAVDYCDNIYAWCSYNALGNSKFWYCPMSPSCDVTISVSDEKWLD